jgi:hypothetical protein
MPDGTNPYTFDFQKIATECFQIPQQNIFQGDNILLFKIKYRQRRILSQLFI